MSFHKANTFLESARYAIDGIVLAVRTQKNVQRMCLICVFVIILSFIFQLNQIEWIVIVFSFSLAISAEMINTTIETVIDSCYGDNYSLVAKQAKDYAAGAVLIISLGDVVVGLLIFVPKALLMLGF